MFHRRKTYFHIYLFSVVIPAYIDKFKGTVQQKLKRVKNRLMVGKHLAFHLQRFFGALKIACGLTLIYLIGIFISPSQF